MEIPKSYYLLPIRSIVAGAILMLFGLALTFGFVDLNASLSANLQMIFISFEDIPTFIFSVIALGFKALFIIGGWFYIKNSDGVERARLDEKGFYYRKIQKAYRYTRVMMDFGPLTFIAYANIKAITYRKSFWLGGQITLDDGAEIKLLPALNVLNEQEKQEIVAFINKRMTNGREYNKNR